MATQKQQQTQRESKREQIFKTWFNNFKALYNTKSGEDRDSAILIQSHAEKILELMRLAKAARLKPDLMNIKFRLTAIKNNSRADLLAINPESMKLLEKLIDSSIATISKFLPEVSSGEINKVLTASGKLVGSQMNKFSSYMSSNFSPSAMIRSASGFNPLVSMGVDFIENTISKEREKREEFKQTSKVDIDNILDRISAIRERDEIKRQEQEKAEKIRQRMVLREEKRKLRDAERLKTAKSAFWNNTESAEFGYGLNQNRDQSVGAAFPDKAMDLLEKIETDLVTIYDTTSNSEKLLTRISDYTERSATASEQLVRIEKDNDREDYLNRFNKQEFAFESLGDNSILQQKADGEDKKSESGGSWVDKIINFIIKSIVPVTLLVASGLVLLKFKGEELMNWFKDKMWRFVDRAELFIDDMVESVKKSVGEMLESVKSAMSKIESVVTYVEELIQKLPFMSKTATNAGTIGSKIPQVMGATGLLGSVGGAAGPMGTGIGLLLGSGIDQGTRYIRENFFSSAVKKAQPKSAVSDKPVVNVPAVTAVAPDSAPMTPTKEPKKQASKQDTATSKRITRKEIRNAHRLDKYNDYFDEASAETGIPTEVLKGIAMKESSGGVNLIGDGGNAVGMMQLHEDAAREGGIDPSDRMDHRKSILAAARYLKLKLREWNGDMDAALAAYNQGTGGMRTDRNGAIGKGRFYARIANEHIDQFRNQKGKQLEKKQTEVAKLRDNAQSKQVASLKNVNNLSSSNNHSPHTTIHQHNNTGMQTASIINAWHLGIPNPVAFST